MSRLSITVSALALIAAPIAIPAEAAQRAFVSSSGDDANTGSGCGLAAPCRSFEAAQTVVSDGGEIVALDAAGYGPITITKNLTLTSNPGFHAGIAAASGDAVTIATAGINVTLRGLNINGTGGNNGVNMTNGARLSIENCVISNFAGGNGVTVTTPATVRIVDSLFRDNAPRGVLLDYGATATISGTKVLGSGQEGIFVQSSIAGETTTAAISDSLVSGSSDAGILVTGSAGATVLVSVIRSTLTNNLESGARVNGAGGTAVLTLSDSMVTGNPTTGLEGGGYAGSTIESLGNNTVRQNGANTSGLITIVPSI
jgi:Right handed beta helix region